VKWRTLILLNALEKGFVHEGWWDTLLRDAEFEAQRRE
jgi:hypothetical protein